MRRTLVPLALAVSAVAATAQPVVDPQPPRREVRVPKLPSSDLYAGAFAGIYATENFGAAAVTGARLGYAISEDFFVEASTGRTTVSDEAFRQILPGGGVLGDPKSRLSYYALSAGWNLLTGESFFGSGNAKASSLYLLGGIGRTRFVEQRQQTLHVGVGTRLMWNDRFAVQADVRDHVFSLDLLGKRRRTQNPELSLGLAVFF